MPHLPLRGRHRGRVRNLGRLRFAIPKRNRCPVPKGRSGIPAPVFFLLVDLALVLQVPQAGVAGRQDERLDLLHHGEGKQGRRDQSALVIVLLHGHHADALADF